MSNQVFASQLTKYGGAEMRLKLKVDQSIPNNINEEIIWDVIIHSTITGLTYDLLTGIFTCVKPGSYIINVGVIFKADVVGLRCLAVSIDGELDSNIKTCLTDTDAAIQADLSLCQTVLLEKGQTLTMLCIQSSGGLLDIVGSDTSGTDHTLMKIVELQ